MPTDDGDVVARRSSLSRLQFVRGATIGAAGVAAGVAGLGGCRGERVSVAAPDQDAADLASLRQVDPRLVIYREIGRVETGFAEARGIAAGGDGALSVAGDSAVRTFDGDGTLTREVAVGALPRCVALAPDGGLVVGYVDHIDLHDSAGLRTASWPSLGERARITAVAASAAEVWTADSGNRVAVGYDHSGREVGRVGRRDDTAHYPGLVLPSPHLEVAIRGDRVVVNNPGNHRVETHTRKGKLLSAWGEAGNTVEGFCGCCNPTNFAILPDGRFVTSEKGLPRVKLYSARGDFEGVVAAPDAFGANVVGLDLATDHEGRVYVLDPKAHAVRIFAPKA